MISEINIIGTGGHSKVVSDVAQRNDYKKINYFDNDAKKWDVILNIYPLDDLKEGKSIVAIGSNSLRKSIVNEKSHLQWKSLIHPTAIIGTNVSIGEGTVVMAGAIIQHSTIIGKHCIINTGACIDHDCNIENYVHIAPNASIAGNVTIKEGSFIGIGSAIINNITIEQWCIIGAGSVLINDLKSNVTVVGNPAKFIKNNLL